MRPSGMDRTIKRPPERVNCIRFTHLSHSRSVTTSLTSVKMLNPLPLPKCLPRASLFALNCPVTLSPIPALPEWASQVRWSLTNS